MEESNSLKYVDLFERLQGKPGVLEIILQMLDDKSLRNVQCVCKSWNEGVKDRVWKKKLQHRLKCKQIWKEIYELIQINQPMDSASDSLVNGDHSSAKQLYKQIYMAAQKLDKNWRTGKAKVKAIKLNDTMFDLYKEQEFIKDMLAMNKRFVIIACRNGTISFFNRRNMELEKEIVHERELKFIKFDGDYFVSAGGLHIKIWDKNSLVLLETFESINAPFCITHHLALSHGTLACFSNTQVYENVSGTNKIHLAVWRLEPRQRLSSPQDKIAVLVHQEICKPPRKFVGLADITDKYILSFLYPCSDENRNVPNGIIQLRSTANFTIVHTFKDPDVFFLLPLRNNLFLVHSVELRGFQPKVKILDCDKKTIRDAPAFDKNMCMAYIGSNTNNFVVSCIDRQEETAGIFYTGAFHQSRDLADFPRSPLCKLKTLKLGANDRSSNLVDFIVDEFGILQYYHHQKEFFGPSTCKLIQLDFLGEVGVEKRPFSSTLGSHPWCAKCKKITKSLKRCSRCRQIFYCSVDCQRSDWSFHKTFCFP